MITNIPSAPCELIRLSCTAAVLHNRSPSERLCATRKEPEEPPSILEDQAATPTNRRLLDEGAKVGTEVADFEAKQDEPEAVAGPNGEAFAS